MWMKRKDFLKKVKMRERRRRKNNPPPRQSTEYTKYIASDRWAAIREKAFAHYGRSCCLCGSADNLHVHHRRYPQVYGEETMQDLTVLCSKCHDAFHAAQKLRKPPRSKCIKKMVTYKRGHPDVPIADVLKKFGITNASEGFVSTVLSQV